MKNPVFTMIAFCFFIFTAKAQTAPPNTVFEAAPLQLVEQLPQDGTYQIILKKGSEQVQVADAILKQVDKNRQYDKESFLKVDEKTRIKILPYTTIQAKDFKPVDKYAYEN
jgi:hypothetical protein